MPIPCARLRCWDATDDTLIVGGGLAGLFCALSIAASVAPAERAVA